MNEITNNKVNLCDSCSQVYPDCTSKPENVYFGDGVGNDNICACSEYQPSVQLQSTMGQVTDAVQSTKDCISRQAAIDALGEKPLVWDDLSDFDLGKAAQWSDDVDAIKALPSAQPETCMYWDRESNFCALYRPSAQPVNYGSTKSDSSSQLTELPSAQPQWIPVTERLPERGKDVLVTRDYDGRADHIKSCRYVEVASCYGEDDDVSWNSYSDEYKMTPKNHRVVAWMPLPEPPKDGGDE